MKKYRVLFFLNLMCSLLLAPQLLAENSAESSIKHGVSAVKYQDDVCSLKGLAHIAWERFKRLGPAAVYTTLAAATRSQITLSAKLPWVGSWKTPLLHRSIPFLVMISGFHGRMVTHNHWYNEGKINNGERVYGQDQDVAEYTKFVILVGMTLVTLSYAADGNTAALLVGVFLASDFLLFGDPALITSVMDCQVYITDQLRQYPPFSYVL